uniref:RanBP2-type domain-containing protein n=1 Tax=Ananas comosus var. bracteatus TaxID=296719 RepID=A0A6V7QD25_ANACO|nr:unnamed protein product [Ananas comosus var. bracteatus]
MSSSSSSSSSWACSRCTFINPPSQKSSCQVCLSPSLLPPPSSSSSPSPPPPSSSSSLRWNCRACTFSNAAASSSCEMCGAAAPYSAALADAALDPDEISDPSVGSVFLPLRRCGRKRPALDAAERPEGDMAAAYERPSSSELGNAEANSKGSTFKIMTYNVWFREDLELHRRMEALGDLVQQHKPDLICFQEVTPNIYQLFQNSKWWKEYKCSISYEMAAERPYFCMQLSKLPVKAFNVKPFSNSIMGRELCLADINIGGGRNMVLATTHLESPCLAPPRWDQMYSKERTAQADESLSLLSDSPNVIFGGDMNWDEKSDGPFPLPNGWIDAWVELKRGENGWTYDTKANPMLTGNWTLQKRLDRFVCKLKDFKVESVEMIGKEAISGLSYCKEKKVRKEVKQLVLPVLPSDHFGLLLTVSSHDKNV